LADYLRARGQSRVRAALLGAPVLIGHGVEYVDFFSSLPSESWPAYAAIGASFLNGSSVPAGGPGTGRDSEKGRVNFFDAYRRLTPEAVFGGSVYLYRVR
jgi:hypothetical protein